MERIILESSIDPNVSIKRVAGNLTLRGWHEDSIRIEFQHPEDLDYSWEDDQLEISCKGDLSLRIPENSELVVEAVSGNAAVNGLDNDLEIKKVSGSLNLVKVGESSIGAVSGNLTARNIEGDLEVAQVSGNATVRLVEGDFSAQNVSANLSIRNVEGDINAKCGSNADLRIEPNGNDVNIQASGSIFCIVEDDADLDVSFKSGAESIQIDTDKGRQSIKSQEHAYTMGDGGADVNLVAGGHIDFRSRGRASDFDFNIALDPDLIDGFSDLAVDLGDQISAQMEERLEALNIQLEEMGEQLRESGSRAAAEAERHVAKAQRKLAENLRRRQQRSPSRVVTVAANRPKSDPVTAKERSMILQMLQDKKISVEEAEMLLNSLEGRATPQAAAAPQQPEEPETPQAPQASADNEEAKQ